MLKLRLISKPKMMKLKCNFSFPNIVLANLQEKEIQATKEDIEVVADVPYDGLSKVDIKGYKLKLQEKKINPTKSVQEIVASEEYDGLSKVIVDKIPDEYIIPSGSLEISQNGTYDVTDKASAKVNVPDKILGTKTITTNGTYKAIDDNLDGYSEVEVSTSGVDINEYFNTEITRNNYQYFGTNSFLKQTPNINVSSDVTSLQRAFQGASMLKKITLTGDTSKVTNTSYTFFGCTILEEISLFDTSSVKIMESMLYSCENLKNIPLFNTSKVTNMQSMFNNCYVLEEVPALDTSSVTNMSNMFTGCRKLKKIAKLNASKVIDVSNMFQSIYNNSTFIEFGGLENLGEAFMTNMAANYSDYKLDLSMFKKLSHDSLMNVINNLYDIKTKGCNVQQLVLGSTNLAKLTAEEINLATAKGFSVL